jgi:DNA mismatch endonuclease (patch repair protein)
VLLPIQHFVEAERSEVMARIRGRGNLETELALARLLRAHGVTGWRRQQKLRIEGRKRRARTAEAQRRRRRGLRQSRPTNVGIDFLFPKQRVAVFVDGCFWHGCPVHSPPARWLAKSTMPERTASRSQKTEDRTGSKRQQRFFAALRMTKQGEDGMTPGAGRTGKTFWREKLTANIARDRLVTRQLRRQGWRVVRIWEHELGRRAKGQEGSGEQVLARIRQAVGGEG